MWDGVVWLGISGEWLLGCVGIVEIVRDDYDLWGVGEGVVWWYEFGEFGGVVWYGLGREEGVKWLGVVGLRKEVVFEIEWGWVGEVDIERG